MNEETQYWLDDQGGTHTHTIFYGEDGEPTAEGGRACPDPDLLLSPEDLESLILDDLTLERIRWESLEASKEARSIKDVELRLTQVAELKALGLSSDTAEAMIAEVIAYTAVPYRVTEGLDLHLHQAYRLPETSVSRIMEQVEG